jgi:NADPH:quinone reductase-like Zn-dependent oxidoreductase
MSSMQRAVLIRAYGGADAVEVAEVEKPEAGQGQVLVRVRAAGVNGIDWKVREGYMRDAFPLPFPIVLRAEVAGVVEAVGPGVSRFRVGDRVMDTVGGLGAYAEFVAINEANLCRTPTGRRGLWIINTPDAELLEPLAAGIASGRFTSTISEVVGFADIPMAIERNRTASRAGKVVADFSR